MEDFTNYTESLYSRPKEKFVFLVVVTKKEREPQKWDEGPNDTPSFEFNTYNHICKSREEVEKVYSENKHALTITTYDCFKKSERLTKLKNKTE
jgi:hypothetical protein